jgi:hypothetical protein
MNRFARSAWFLKPPRYALASLGHRVRERGRVSGDVDALHDDRPVQAAVVPRMVTPHFCPECGSTVYYRLPPDAIGVPVGAFCSATPWP